ncbi:hypothetical protein LTR97_009362 [Elasticomyces elasticus]|uniref:Uncharacterized protein n=1 Tax=Elasticomyces elasticus TaxID=574655 RepID=A0AAN7WBF6_9PEZI|nr:hypothetical protein LTR97_009362 [Elasticomyces elasticus]
MAQPQPPRATELQRPGYGSDQSTANGASQQSNSSRLNSAAADDHASEKGTRGVEQAEQNSQVSTTTDKVQVSSMAERSAVDVHGEYVSTDQRHRATEEGKGKRKFQDDDEDLEAALTKGEDKRLRMGETKDNAQFSQDGWKRSF